MNYMQVQSNPLENHKCAVCGSDPKRVMSKTTTPIVQKR